MPVEIEYTMNIMELVDIIERESDGHQCTQVLTMRV